MGSKGGSTTKSSGMNFGTSTQTPNPQAMAAYQGVLGQASSVNQIPYQMYQGQQVAGFSPDQMAAQQGVRESQGIALPFIDAASTAVGRAMEYADPNRFNQQEVSRYFNPYQQNVIDATMANMQEMNASQQNQVTGNAIQKGYMGGDRAGIARAELARQQAMTNNSTLAQLQHQGYQSSVDQWNKAQQQAIAAQQAGAYSFGQLGTQAQNSVMQGLQALAASGAQQQGLQQQQLTADYENWQRAMGYPYQQTQWNAGITGAIAPNMGGTTTSMSMGENSKTEPGPSVGGQVAGLLTSGLSLLPKFGDGGRVGRDEGGGIPYVERPNPFDDPQRQWQEGMRPWVSANADGQPAPDAVMRAAGGSLADPLAKREEGGPFGGDGAWIPNVELHPAAPQFPAPAKPVDLDTGGGGGGDGGGDILGSLTKGLGSLAGKMGGKSPIQLPSASHSAPAHDGGTAAPPIHSADDDRFAGIYADGGRVGYAEGGAPSVPTVGGALHSGGFGNLFAGWAARGAPTGVAGSSLMPSFEAPTTRQSLPTAPAAPDAGGFGGMNPMMMMGGGGKNSGMMAMMAIIQQQQQAAKYQQDMAKYNTDLAAAKAAPRSINGYVAGSRDYGAIDPMTGLYAARGWTPTYQQLYADGGRVDELEGLDARKFHPELMRERDTGDRSNEVGDLGELMSAMQRRQQRPGRLRGGEIEDEELTINPVGRILPGAPTDYEERPVGVPLPPDHRPQEFEQHAGRGLSFDEAAAQTRKFEGGYSNDSGGPTMYGISSKAHPGLDVRSITPQQAQGIYKKQYWDAIGADSIENPALRRVAYDTAIISGPGRARQFMAQSGGDPEKFMQAREEFMQRLVAQNPRKYGAYARGWANRNAELRRTAGLGGDEGGEAMAYGPTELASRHPGLGAIDANFRNSRETGGASGAPAQEERTGLGSMWSPEVQQGLLAAGLGMLASRSPHMGVAIGEGGLRGVQAYQAAKSGAGDAEYKRAQLDHLTHSEQRAQEEWEYKKRAQERSQKAWELLNPKDPGGASPTESSDAPKSAPADGEGDAPAPAPEKAGTGAPMEIRPGAVKPPEPASAPTFKVPNEVQNKLRAYHHNLDLAGQAEAAGNPEVARALRSKADAAKFEYEQGLSAARHAYDQQYSERQKLDSEERAKQRDLEKEKREHTEKLAAEERKIAAEKEAELRKPPTESQKDALKFGQRMLEGEQYLLNPRILRAANGPGANTQEGFGKIPVVGDYLQSKEYKSFQQAGSNWVLGLLRDDSGAAIGTPEYIRAYATYIPSPGDPPEIVKQKADARRREEMSNGAAVHPAHAEEFTKRFEESHARYAKQWKPGDKRAGMRDGKKITAVMQQDGSWKVEDGQ